MLLLLLLLLFLLLLAGAVATYYIISQKACLATATATAEENIIAAEGSFNVSGSHMNFVRRANTVQGGHLQGTIVFQSLITAVVQHRQ